MWDTFRAIYRNGAFVPVVPCNLPEETEVEIAIREEARLACPTEADATQRKKGMRDLIARMQSNPLPENAPKFTREELHERG